MKNLLTSLCHWLPLIALLVLTACNDDEPEPKLTGESTSYDLRAVGGSGTSGTITFAERDDDKVLITIQLTGTQTGNTHPAHLHSDNAAVGGGIILDLSDVMGISGKSETVVNALNDGTPFSYEDVSDLDAYVNVHLSPSDLATIVSQGDIGQNALTEDSKAYALNAVSNPAILGTATFSKRINGEILAVIALEGTADGADHPAHIHANSAVQGGGIALDLANVDGSTGESRTNITALNNGTPISYEELLNYNGYINVHESPTVLGTLVAQGDIGGNELTGDKKQYTLGPVSDPGISGTATFEKRKNGTTLVTVALTGTTAGLSHASHIHANTAVQGGGIAINLTNVNGTTGMARSQVSQLNSGTAITYEELLEFNGYLNVHFGTGLIAQGDIGQNELTGEKEEYTLGPVSDPGITGTATFAKRKNGTTLVTIALTGTTADASHPAHIHANSAAQGGGIMIDLTNVNGTTGISRTQVSQLNSGTAITYNELIDYNGYINVHLSSTSLSTLVAQGDIGQNELTGDNKVYTLNAVSDPNISGTATFAKRRSGKALITIQLQGTTTGGDHPAHLHANSVIQGGGIVLDLRNVNGTTGRSATSVNTLNAGTAISYDELLVFNGYINVHLSSTSLSTIIAQGNIGSNAP